MSGVNWIPVWALEAGDATSRFALFGGRVVRARLKNWFSDERVARQRHLRAKSRRASIIRRSGL